MSSPKEVYNVRRRNDERRLENLRNRLIVAHDLVTRRSLELAIEETEARMARESSPEVMAAVEDWQADYERRQQGDPAQNAEREAQSAARRDLRQSDIYRRKVGEYGLVL